MRRGLVDALLRCASASGRGALEQAGPSSSIIQCSLGAGLDHAAAACSCVASDVPHALEAPDAAAGAADRREARRRLSIGVMSQALPSAPGSAAGTCSRHFHDGVHEQQPLLALPPPASPCWPHAASDAACTSPPGPQQQHHQQAGAEHSQHQHLDHVPLCHSAWPGAAGARHPQGLPDRTLSTCSAAATALANSASPALLAAATTHPSSSGTEPNLPPRLRHLPGPSALAAARAWPAAQQQQQQQRRHASTLTKAGVPNPRPEVEAALSTHHGGHVARLIHATQTLAELEQTLAKHARSLGNVHWAAAALQLERLARQERASPTALRVKSIAARVEEAGVAYAPRMAVLHLAPLIRGLTGASHALAPGSLDALAAVLLANGCAQLRLASDTQWKHLVWGFSMQGYDKALFWERLAQEAIPLIPKWNGNRVASVVKNLTMVGVRSAPLMRAGMERMVEQAHAMGPYPVADALYALACGYRLPPPPAAAADGSQEQQQQEQEQREGPGAIPAALRAQFVRTLTARGLERLHAADAKCCALFLSSLAQLRAGSPEIAAGAVAAAGLLALPPHLASPQRGDAAAGLAQEQEQQQSLHPIYAQKLVQACVSMGHRDVRLAAVVAARARGRLGAADEDTLRRLRQALLAAVAQEADGGEAGEAEEAQRTRWRDEVQGLVREIERLTGGSGDGTRKPS